MLERKFQFQPGDLICLDLSGSIPYKKKKHLIDALNQKGYRVSFILNKTVKWLIKDDRKSLDSYKCRNAFKLNIPVIHVDFVAEFLQTDARQDLKASKLVDKYLIKNQLDEQNFKQGKVCTMQQSQQLHQGQIGKRHYDLSKVKVFNQSDDDVFKSDFESEGFDLIKWMVFHVNI